MQHSSKKNVTKAVDKPANEPYSKPANATRVLVFGASGYIGTNLVPKLVAHGYQVRAAARNKKILEARHWEGVELVEADALLPATLPSAFAGIDIAYFLVHSMSAGKNLSELERQTANNFAKAAARAGVKRIIYLGGLIPGKVESEHLLARQLTGNTLRQGSVPVTEIRAGMIVGPGSAAFEVMRDLVNNLPVMVTPRWVKSKSPPIALDNLLYYLVHAPAKEEMKGKIFDAAGPEILSYEELMRQFADLVDKKPAIFPVPVLTPKLSSYWLRLVTTVPTNIASALIAGLKSDIPANSRPIEALIPQKLLNFRESVQATFAAEKQNRVAARWTEGALQFRDYNPAYAFYAKKASGTAIADASLADVWERIIRIGGRTRYYGFNWLWTIREVLDWSIGGPGRNRGRRDPTRVRIGDTVDSWRVIGVQHQKSLTLMMGMKAPGAGVLELEAEALAANKTKITATAYWHPAGTTGLLYWYTLVPAHLFIFDGMTRNIARLAKAKCSDKTGKAGKAQL